jgi:hypothetical protein
MNLRGPNSLTAPWQLNGVVPSFMGQMVIPTLPKTMDLILSRDNGFEFASRILGGSQFLDPYQQGMRPKNLQP